MKNNNVCCDRRMQNPFFVSPYLFICFIQNNKWKYFCSWVRYINLNSSYWFYNRGKVCYNVYYCTMLQISRCLWNINGRMIIFLSKNVLCLWTKHGRYQYMFIKFILIFNGFATVIWPSWGDEENIGRECKKSGRAKLLRILNYRRLMI